MTTWQLRTVDRSGFEFGLDEVTPVAWKLVRSSAFDKKAYCILTLPDPKPEEDMYYAWLAGTRGKVIVHSVRELRSLISTLRGV